jgi:acetylornithine deacetylase/succinyl-diaminopimelate desuccinylase-like protein
VTYFQSMTIHHPDEAIRIGAFQDGVEYLRGVVKAWANE